MTCVQWIVQQRSENCTASVDAYIILLAILYARHMFGLCSASLLKWLTALDTVRAAEKLTGFTTRLWGGRSRKTVDGATGEPEVVLIHAGIELIDLVRTGFDW